VTLTLTSNDPAGPCGAVSSTAVITINPAATVNAGASQTVCASSPAVTLAGSVGGAATNGTWSGGTGAFNPSPTALNAIYTPSAAEIAAGTVTLTLTSSDPVGSCGAVSGTVVITINSAATVNAGTNQTVCASSPAVTLAGNVGGAATNGTWSGGTGTFSPSSTATNATYTPSAAEVAAGTVTLTLTSNDPAGPCGAVSSTVVITFSAAAPVSAGTNQTVCASSPAVTLTGGGITNGTWSGGTGTFSPSTTATNATYTPSAAEIAAGTVTLTLTSNDPAGPCGVASSTVVITIDAAATVNAGTNQTVCASSPAVILAGSVGGAATNGTWSGGTGTFSPSATATNVTYTPSAAEIAVGTVTLTLTSNDPAGPCGVVSNAVVITINPAATVDAGTNQTVCASSPAVTLAGRVGGGVTNGTWIGGTGTFNPGRAATNAIYTPSAAEITAGTVTLTLASDKPAGPCGAVSNAVVITINPAATLDAGTNQTVCASSPDVTLAGSVSGAATNATWSGGTGTFNPGRAATNAIYTPSVAEIAAGTVTLTLTSNDPVGSCGVVSNAMVITIDSPTVIAGADQEIFAWATNQVVLAGEASGAATNVIWSTSGDGVFSLTNKLNTTYSLGTNDMALGGVALTLTSAISEGSCGPADSMNVWFKKLRARHGDTNTVVIEWLNGLELVSADLLPTSSTNWIPRQADSTNGLMLSLQISTTNRQSYFRLK